MSLTLLKELQSYNQQLFSCPPQKEAKTQPAFWTTIFHDKFLHWYIKPSAYRKRTSLLKNSIHLVLSCSVHWGINPHPPPLKTPSPFSGQVLSLLNLQTVQAPPTPFPPLKIGFFSETLKYFSWLTPSYFLEATKFLVKIWQFQF